ncbi:protein FAR1-RELATED SEQUENCE 5-like [Apium graveolens]|uniref:protein FAR1-RELATED SEQUENCE 5-like n=1 Tax=Apium graveolens TaxID=4045 RepID=UPI003D7A21FD
MVPKVGLEFESEEDAYRFYNAEKVGFGIRRSKMHKSDVGEILDRVFVCACEGKRTRNKRDDDVKQHRLETRFSCKAKMGVSSRSNGKYKIFKFIYEHSHDLISPSKSHFLRSHGS